MVTLNTQAAPAAQPTCQEALHARIVKILEGGPCAIDERLKEIEQSAPAAAPSMSASIIAAGESVLHRLFGARFAPKSANTAVDPLDLERERIALRALRGDFQSLPTVHQIEDRHALLRMEGEGGIAVDHDDAKHDHESAVCAVEAVLLVTGAAGK